MDEKEEKQKTVQWGNLSVESTSVLGQLYYVYNTHENFQSLDKFSCHVQPNTPTKMLNEAWEKELCNKVAMSPCAGKILSENECISLENAQIILDDVKLTKTKLANDIVIYGAMAAFAIISYQAYHLKMAWNAIKDAQNLTDKSKNKIALIGSKMDSVDTGVIDLQKLKDKWESENIPVEQKRQLMDLIRMKMSRMSLLLVDTKSLISDLTVTVNGTMERLMSSQDQRITNGFMNGIQCIANLVQSTFLGSGALTAPFKVIQGLIITSFALLTVGNAVVYYITEKELATIRELLNDINELDIHWSAVIGFIHGTEDWVVAVTENHE